MNYYSLRKLICLVAPLVCCAAWPAAAHAQSDYPRKSIRLVVPSAPGGGTDLVARMLAQRVSEAWGQPVIVENNSGGATTIGTHLVAKAAPDGYTLLMTTAAISGEVHMLIANVASLLPNVKAGRLRALALPALQQRFAEIGIEPVGGTPEKFAAYVAVEIKKWGAVARDANIRAD